MGETPKECEIVAMDDVELLKAPGMFALKVTSDALTRAGILSGDIVLFAPRPTHEGAVIALIDEDVIQSPRRSLRRIIRRCKLRHLVKQGYMSALIFMKSRFISFALLIVFFATSFGSMYGDEKSSVLDVILEVRYVQSLIDIETLYALPNSSNPWILGHTTPSANNFTVTVRGGSKDLGNGKYEMTLPSGNSNSVMMVSTTLHVDKVVIGDYEQREIPVTFDYLKLTSQTYLTRSSERHFYQNNLLSIAPLVKCHFLTSVDNVKEVEKRYVPVAIIPEEWTHWINRDFFEKLVAENSIVKEESVSTLIEKAVIERNPMIAASRVNYIFHNFELNESHVDKLMEVSDRRVLGAVIYNLMSTKNELLLNAVARSMERETDKLRLLSYVFGIEFYLNRGPDLKNLMLTNHPPIVENYFNGFKKVLLPLMSTVLKFDDSFTKRMVPLGIVHSYDVVLKRIAEEEKK